MSMNYEPNYGYGVHVPSETLIKNSQSDDFDLEEFVYDLSGVLLDGDTYDQVHNARLWHVDKQHELTEAEWTELVGCVLPFQVEPLIFGNTNRTYDDVIASLHAEYGQYLVDGFDFHKHFVKFEVVEFC